jgi:hypothetical protein
MNYKESWKRDIIEGDSNIRETDIEGVHTIHRLNIKVILFAKNA